MSLGGTISRTILIVAALLLGCSRVHEFGLGEQSTDSATETSPPSSTCGLAYFESFDSDPFGSSAALAGNHLTRWRVGGMGDAPIENWAWEDTGLLISDTSADGGHLAIEVAAGIPKFDGPGPGGTNISHELWTPYFDVRGCRASYLQMLHHAANEADTDAAGARADFDIYYHLIDAKSPTLYISQSQLFAPNDGLISWASSAPLGGPIEPGWTYMAWVFYFHGDYVAPINAHWQLDNLDAWGTQDTDTTNADCALLVDIPFDSDPFVAAITPTDDSLWSRIDSSPPPDRGSTWRWSDQNNTIPGGADGHLRVGSSAVGTEAGVFSEMLLSPVFDVSSCGGATVRLDYAFLRSTIPHLAPLALIELVDADNGQLLGSKWLENSESGTIQIDAIVTEATQVRLQVLYQGSSRTGQDYHLEIDQLSILGTS